MITVTRYSRDYAFEIMTTFGLIVVLLAAVTAATSLELRATPCTPETCRNLTFFLGPKWGAKTIQLPLPKLKETSEEKEEVKTNTEGNSNIKPTDWVIVPQSAEFEEFLQNQREFEELMKKSQELVENKPKQQESEEQTKNQREFDRVLPVYNKPLFPKRRPVPEDDSLRVDYSDVQQSRFRFGPDETTESATKVSFYWTALDDVNNLFDAGSLNLTGFGLTGQDAKQALYNLSSDSRSRLQSLSLSRNQIRSLPVLCFPVELEYELRELWLDNNPLGRLDTYTRFELSRLNSLKKLSLARTRLLSLESLYIPSLEALDLSGNSLNVYNYFSLQGLVNLKNLNLSHNNFKCVSVEPLDSSTKLQVLDLSNNLLSSLNGLSLYTMINLETLYLNNNSLKYSYDIESVPYGVSLYVAGNPWECSCPLVRTVNQAWKTIADKQAMRCTDNNIRIPWPVTSLTEADVTVACPVRGVKGWLKSVEHRFEDVLRWFRVHLRFLSPLATVLWWALLVGALVAVVRLVRRHKSKTPSASIPYNILDDKHVI